MDDPVLSQKFISTMKIYILNSFVYSTNDFILGILSIVFTKVFYRSEGFMFLLYPSYEFMFYFTYIRNNLAILSYAFGGLMDIYFFWGRIQIFKPQYTFLLHTPQNKVAFYILIISIALTIPNDIMRQVTSYEFHFIETNTSKVLYTYGN